MDTESDQKARRFTKLPWCEKRRTNPRKKVSGCSQKAGQAGAAGKISPDAQKTRQVNPMFGAWMLAAAIVAAVLLMGVGHV